MINRFFDFLLPYSAYSYFFIFTFLIACGLGVPLPEDVVLVTGGLLVGEGVMDFTYTVILCMFGVLAGDSIIFFLGKYYGEKIIKSKIISRFVDFDLYRKRVESMVRKYGAKIIFIARFMPGFRAPTYFFMGTFKKPYWMFLLIDFLAAIISVPAWIYFGVFFQDNLPLLEQQMKKFRLGIYAIIALIVILLIGGYFLKKKAIEYINSKGQ